MTGCVGGPSPPTNTQDFFFALKTFSTAEVKPRIFTALSSDLKIKSHPLMNFTDFLLFSSLFSINLKSTAAWSQHQLFPVLILKFSLFAVLRIWAEGKSRPCNVEREYSLLEERKDFLVKQSCLRHKTLCKTKWPCKMFHACVLFLWNMIENCCELACS